MLGYKLIHVSERGPGDFLFILGDVDLLDLLLEKLENKAVAKSGEPAVPIPKRNKPHRYPKSDGKLKLKTPAHSVPSNGRQTSEYSTWITHRNILFWLYSIAHNIYLRFWCVWFILVTFRTSSPRGRGASVFAALFTTILYPLSCHGSMGRCAPPFWWTLSQPPCTASPQEFDTRSVLSQGIPH